MKKGVIIYLRNRLKAGAPQQQKSCLWIKNNLKIYTDYYLSPNSELFYNEY